MMRTATLLFLLALGPLVPSPARAADRADLERIVREQRTIKARLEKILSKMERLEKRLRSEGKTYNANLLAKAIEETRRRQIEARIDELLPDLAGGRFTAVERQEKLLAELESVYAILLDRNDLERIEEKLRRLRENLEEISDLRAEQDRLVEETRRLAQMRQAQLAELERQARAALEQQKAVRSETERGGDEFGDLERERARIEEAIEAQRALLSTSRRRLREAVGEAGERLREALRRAAELADRLKNDPAEGDVEEELADLDPEEIARDGGFGEEERAALERAAAARREALAAASRGEREEALRALERLEEELARAWAERKRRASGDVAPPAEERERQRLVAEAAAEAARRTESAAPDASDALEEASEAADRAAEQMEAGDPEEVERAQAEALERLAEAARSLDERLAPSRREREELAARQEYVAGRTGEIRRRLEEMAGREEASDPQAGARAENGRRAEEAAREAEASLRAGRRKEALAAQQRAERSLEELAEQLAAARRAAEESATDEGERSREALAELSRRQREVERRTRDLARRIREQQERRQEALERAAERMERAGEALEREDAEEALPREEEAREELDRAERELAEEEEKYQNLRQEELLFRVKDELESLRDAAISVRDRVEEIDLERSQRRGGRLRRSERAKLREMAAECRDLRQRNDGVTERIREDGATVFTFTLERNGEDLERLAQSLGTPPYSTDVFTQSIAQDVVDRYEQLLGVLDEELERRRRAEPQPAPPNQNGPNRRQPLVPKVAELLMVKRMEERAMRRIDAFLRGRSDEVEEWNDIDRQRMARLAHEHRSITELFDALVGAEDRGPAPDDGGGGEDGQENER